MSTTDPDPSSSPSPGDAGERPPWIRRLLRLLGEATRRYFIAGLLAFAPIAITIWVIAWIIHGLDNLLLPQLIDWLWPHLDRPPDIPPLVGLVFTFAVILLAGVLVRHFFGHEAIRLWERLLHRVPVARSIYVAVKQLVEALLDTTSDATRFRRVVLLEYPRRGVYAIAFVTGTAPDSLQRAVGDVRMLSCFVPTTPNPTSGFYLLIPEDDVQDLDITVEEGFKLVMSAGLVGPDRAAPSGSSQRLA